MYLLILLGKGYPYCLVSSTTLAAFYGVYDDLCKPILPSPVRRKVEKSEMT